MVELIGSKRDDENETDWNVWAVVGVSGSRWIGRPVDHHVTRRHAPINADQTSVVLYPAFEYSSQSSLNRTPEGLALARQRLAVPVEQLALVPVRLVGITHFYLLADFPTNARREIEQVIQQAFDILNSERARLANLTIVNGLGPNMPPPPGR